MIHGGDPEAFAKAMGLTNKPVLDFSVNLNPLGPPKSITKLWNELLQELIPYPSIEGEGIKTYYSIRLGIPKDMVVAGNGATELIYLIPRVLKPNSTLIFEPTYSDYKRASLHAGLKIFTYKMDPENGLSYPGVGLMEQLLKNVDSVWLCRPNNPTGSMISKSEIVYLSKKYPDKLFILDESFLQFTKSWFVETLLTKDLPQNIIVIHSLTKFYALAGLRLGAAIAHKNIAETLNFYKEPWTVNAISNKIAPILASEESYEEETREFVFKESKRIRDAIKSMKNWKIANSNSNFILIRWKGQKHLDYVLKHLYELGIFVRDARNFIGLEDNYVRIGLRIKDENNKLIEALNLVSEGDRENEWTHIAHSLYN